MHIFGPGAVASRKTTKRQATVASRHRPTSRVHQVASLRNKYLSTVVDTSRWALGSPSLVGCLGSMANEIIHYVEMCRRESASLQQGMNFYPDRSHSVVLMSRRPNAPYRDVLDADGETLIYEGHDLPRRRGGPDPKSVDQPGASPQGRLTQNGRFHEAATSFKAGAANPRLVRVYEKLHQGVWSYNGAFRLVDSWIEHDGVRNVYKFKLRPAPDDDSGTDPRPEYEHRRLIPSSVKQVVWTRDAGKCVECGATDGLHFDHILPYSKGGASIVAENVQVLCARHNLEKGAKIQ